jgi:hypothetical protein
MIKKPRLGLVGFGAQGSTYADLSPNAMLGSGPVDVHDGVLTNAA